MFHGTIVNGQKGLACFWEKEWGNINSVLYDEHILSRVEVFSRQHPTFIWTQDNAPSHRSRLTEQNLTRRHIPHIMSPPYSPDLDLIEHVWNWMENWIQEHYFQALYEADKVPYERLREIITEAWNAVPNSFIQTLYDSWWRRCQAVINAKGGPTKY